MNLPPMRRLFLERADLTSPEFQNWFRNSRVVDASGQPEVLYHGTVNSFDVFRNTRDVGYHFGTKQGAHDRLKHWEGDSIGGKKPQSIMPVYLSVQKPIELHDMLNWEPPDVMKELLEQDLMTQAERDAIMIKQSRPARNDALLRFLKTKGYDGASYTNAAEDKGSKTWIVFEPWQVKSVFNRGTWDRRRGSVNE